MHPKRKPSDIRLYLFFILMTTFALAMMLETSLAQAGENAKAFSSVADKHKYKDDGDDHDDSDDRGDEDELLIRAFVPASLGGVFSDDPIEPRITISIPPGALSRDALLKVQVNDDAPRVRKNQSAASTAFKVKLQKGGRGKGRLRLLDPMKIAIRADMPPVHPEIGEIALRHGRYWQRLNANFFRPSDDNVVALTQNTKGTFSVVNRTLRATTGDAVDRGLQVFMHETFGNENFFGGVLGLHELLNNVAPVRAVQLGAQVDLTKVPQAVVDVMLGDNLDAKDAALSDPATTRILIKAGAVIGVEGVYTTDDPADDVMVSAGITCALCHVTVKPNEFTLNAGTVALPIGVPNLDGVPNSAMDAGAILASTPFAQAAGQGVVDLLNSWGPGNFDIRALPDNPLEDNVNNPTANPPIWNFVDLESQGYLFGWDGLFENDGVNNNALASQAEAVYDLVMHGNGAFGTANGTLPPELSIVPLQDLLDALALAEAEQPGNDVTLDKLLDMQAWMRSIVSPESGDFDEEMAEAGFELFHGEASCSRCHSTAELTGPGTFTDITSNPPAGDLAGGIHVPSLRGISHTAPYFHDSSAATLEDVVLRFVDRGAPVPALSFDQQQQLVEYLKSL